MPRAIGERNIVSTIKLGNDSRFEVFLNSPYKPNAPANKTAIQGNLPYSRVKYKTPIQARTKAKS
jgi:hypothetical protein